LFDIDSFWGELGYDQSVRVARGFMTTNLFIGERSLKSWTVQDYHQMSDLGLLDPTERTELIDGQIVLIVAKGNPHILTVRLLTRVLEAALRDRPVLVIIPITTILPPV
jgi:Uma2 family endonuclease